jgi:hypothetical protein
MIMDRDTEVEKLTAWMDTLGDKEPPVVVGVEILKYLGLDPASIEAQALVLLCRRYRLDPLLGEASVITTKSGRRRVYISRDGMLKIAHRSGFLDGIVVDEQRESEHGWSATVSVWRKDMAHPFTYKGGCGVDESQAEHNGAEMALARAERRALRRAFDIPAHDTDDVADEPEPVGRHHQLTATAKDPWRTCTCGQRFGTDAEFAAHQKQPEIPGPAPAMPGPPQAQRADEPPRPAGPGPKRNQRKGRPVEDAPPVDYYDSLPEARGYK